MRQWSGDPQAGDPAGRRDELRASRATPQPSPVPQPADLERAPGTFPRLVDLVRALPLNSVFVAATTTFPIYTVPRNLTRAEIIAYGLTWNRCDSAGSFQSELIVEQATSRYYQQLTNQGPLSVALVPGHTYESAQPFAWPLAVSIPVPAEAVIRLSLRQITGLAPLTGIQAHVALLRLLVREIV